MTTDRPMFTADYHAQRAEALADLARSASMSGWSKRGRRRDMLAAAQVHATLGASALRVENPAAEANIKHLTTQLAATEAQREAASVRERQYADQLEQIGRLLRNYDRPQPDLQDTAEAVQALLEDRLT
jgi:hypothetical protein